VRIGDLVCDSTVGRSGVIVGEKIIWVDERSGNCSYWDYELLYDDGELDYADRDELEVISESR
jgi:hypothetical protein